MIKIRKQICEAICKKSTCSQDINECDGRMAHRCKNINASFINNLNDNQLEYIVSSIEDNIFLKACPGSGKTEVLGIKSAYEIINSRESYKGLAIITFTNSAEYEIKKRVEMYLGETLRYPNYIGTFTSWIHGYIANPFLSKISKYEGNNENDKSIKIIENKEIPNFLRCFSSNYSYKELGNLNPCEYYYDIKEKKIIYCGNKLKNSKKSQEILEKLLDDNEKRLDDLKKLKCKFFKKGFYLYEDIEFLVYILLLKNRDIAKFIANRFPIILIDECQDLSYIQLKIIGLLNKQGCKIHLIGDLNQSIYKFRNIDPQDTLNFINKLDFKQMNLNQNYRSCQEIVDISQVIINEDDDVQAISKKVVEKPLLAILYEKDKEIDVYNKFKDLIRDNGLDLNKSRIIVRNNTLKYKLLGLKKQEGNNNRLETLARAMYMWKNVNNISEFRMTFNLFAKSVQSIYFSGIEHKGEKFFYKPCELDMDEWKGLVNKIKQRLLLYDNLLDFSLTWEKWKKELKKIIDDDINSISELENREYDLGRIRSGNKNKTLEEILSDKESNIIDCKIETIHSCKGMSLDSVLFMSSYKKSNNQDSGTFWREWFDLEYIGEKNRLAYVAFSRARHLLVLGIPKSSKFTDKDKETLINFGFKVI